MVDKWKLKANVLSFGFQSLVGWVKKVFFPLKIIYNNVM